MPRSGNTISGHIHYKRYPGSVDGGIGSGRNRSDGRVSRGRGYHYGRSSGNRGVGSIRCGDVLLPGRVEDGCKGSRAVGKGGVGRKNGCTISAGKVHGPGVAGNKSIGTINRVYDKSGGCAGSGVGLRVNQKSVDHAYIHTERGSAGERRKVGISHGDRLLTSGLEIHDEVMGAAVDSP